MFKIATLAVLAGLATVLPAATAFAQANNQGQRQERPAHDDRECAYPINYLPRVTGQLIQSIAGQPVYLIPVCEDGLLDHRDHDWLFVHGNVDTLRVPLARNATLMRALSARDYNAYDVVSLRVGGDGSIVLYVHRRDMR